MATPDGFCLGGVGARGYSFGARASGGCQQSHWPRDWESIGKSLGQMALHCGFASLGPLRVYFRTNLVGTLAANSVRMKTSLCDSSLQNQFTTVRSPKE